jgi:acetylornithine deacetylase/succinyl-diaminopimelate desuccinylase-like protein
MFVHLRGAVVRLVVVLTLHPALAAAQARTPDQRLLREIYQQLVEINTTDSVGSTTVAAQAVAARLKAAGFADTDVRIVTPSGNPKKGNLVVRLHGTGGRKPLLLLAHLDVVEAKREDWTRDPFKLVEENGFFYGRGTADDKAMAAIFVEQMIRLKREAFRPDRDIVLALTADEELGGSSEFNGVEHLLRAQKPLIDAEYAINEGGGGQLDAQGKYQRLALQVTEKTYIDFRLQVTNPGGHSSVPKADNAIYRMSEALSRLSKFRFPFQLNDVTRLYFERLAPFVTGQASVDMKAILANPPDDGAIDRLSADPQTNAQLRTTCITTMIDGGHAPNALPQRVTATVNCRVMPGVTLKEVTDTLATVIADPAVSIVPVTHVTTSPPSRLNDDFLKAVESVAAGLWPGVPVIPTMSAGGTDGRFLRNDGIPTYGMSGMFNVTDSGSHGLNERMRVEALYEGQEFLYRLTRALSGGTAATTGQ